MGFRPFARIKHHWTVEYFYIESDILKPAYGDNFKKTHKNNDMVCVALVWHAFCLLLGVVRINLFRKEIEMLKKNVIAAMVGLAATVGFAAPAQAITFTGVPYVGFIDADLFGFDSGTTGYLPSGFDPDGAASQSGISCNTVLGCDSAGTIPSANAMGSEDTWGIFRVNAIRDLDGNNLWVAGTGEYLYGMFYGFADKIVEWSTSNGSVFNFKAWSEGGTIKIFEHSSLINNFGLNGPAGRTAVDGFLTGTVPTQINNGNLWLQMAAVAGQSEYSGTTLESGFTSTNASGVSDFYANVTGGTAASFFTRDYEDENGVLRDFYVRNVNTTSGRGLWTVRADSASSAYAQIPEPGTMALAGLGLVGLAALRRRKQA